MVAIVQSSTPTKPLMVICPPPLRQLALRPISRNGTPTTARSRRLTRSSRLIQPLRSSRRLMLLRSAPEPQNPKLRPLVCPS